MIGGASRSDLSERYRCITGSIQPETAHRSGERSCRDSARSRGRPRCTHLSKFGEGGLKPQVWRKARLTRKIAAISFTTASFRFGQVKCREALQRWFELEWMTPPGYLTCSHYRVVRFGADIAIQRRNETFRGKSRWKVRHSTWPQQLGSVSTLQSGKCLPQTALS